MTDLSHLVGDDGISTDRRIRVARRSEEIVTAAATLFAAEGYHEVGMRAIADSIGIRGASLYHHFSSKEEILYAICLRVTEEPVRLHLGVLDGPASPGEKLTRLVRLHLGHLRRRRVEHLVGLQELSALDPAHRTEIGDYRRHYQRRVHETIIEGTRTGEFCIPSAPLASLALLDALNGTSRWFREDAELKFDDVVEGYVELLIRGLLSGGAAALRTEDD